MGEKEIWNLNESLAKIASLGSEVKDLSVNRNASKAAFILNNSINLINLKENSKQSRIYSNGNEIYSLAWHPEKNLLAFTSKENEKEELFLLEFDKLIEITIDKSRPRTLSTSDNVQSEWLTQDFNVSLNVEAAQGLLKTFFRFLEQEEFIEGNLIPVTENGQHVLFYFSEDEAIKEEVKGAPLIKLDKEVPEIILNKEIKEIY